MHPFQSSCVNCLLFEQVGTTLIVLDFYIVTFLMLEVSEKCSTPFCSAEQLMIQKDFSLLLDLNKH